MIDVTKNLGLKVLSLLLAIGLWYGVVSKGSSEISLEVPLEFKNIPKSHEIVWESSKTVTVRVSGHEQRLKRIGPGSISVYVDLGNAKAGEATYSLTSESVRIPGNVSVVKVTPSEVGVRLEEIASSSVAVKPVIKGTPSPGFALGTVTVEPAQVKITGVKGFISSIDQVPTVPIDVGGWVAGEREIEAVIDAMGKSYRVEPGKVKVHVTMLVKSQEAQ